MGKGTLFVPAAHGLNPSEPGDPEGVERERGGPVRAGSEAGLCFRGLHPRLFKGLPFGEKMLPPVFSRRYR